MIRLTMLSIAEYVTSVGDN